MDTNHAVRALSAIANQSRLEVFRVLVKEGARGLMAGEISSRLQINPSTLSFHLGHLERAGLLKLERDGRKYIYSVDTEGVQSLLHFLTDDCCGGHPELCGGLPQKLFHSSNTGDKRDE
jgi:DNA-binding transcriptional ArsR family regulator